MKALVKSMFYLAAVVCVLSAILGMASFAAEESSVRSTNGGDHNGSASSVPMYGSGKIEQTIEKSSDVLSYCNTYDGKHCLEMVNGKDCSITGYQGYTGNFKYCQVELTSMTGQRCVMSSAFDKGNDETVSVTCPVPSGKIDQGSYLLLMYLGTEPSSELLEKTNVVVQNTNF